MNMRSYYANAQRRPTQKGPGDWQPGTLAWYKSYALPETCHSEISVAGNGERHIATQAKSVAYPLPPRQQRSREKMQRILHASYELAAEVGFESATLAEIAKRADIAVGTLYTRFRNKEALLHALHESAAARSRRYITDYFSEQCRSDKPLREILEDMIVVSLELAREIAGFQRACFQRALTDPEFAAREAEVREVLVQQIRKLFSSRRNEIGHPKPKIAADFFVLLYVSVITEHIMADAFKIGNISDKQLARELLAACSAYLKV